jgi:hypothetical protein
MREPALSIRMHTNKMMYIFHHREHSGHREKTLFLARRMGGALLHPSQQPVRFSVVFLAAWRERSIFANPSSPSEHHDGLRCAAPILRGAGMIAKSP